MASFAGSTALICWRRAKTQTWRRSNLPMVKTSVSVMEFPNELEIVTPREFDAPIEVVFDVFIEAGACEQMVRSICV